MSEDQFDNAERLAREKALYLYANGLERGDFGIIETVLEQATSDVELEEMILELHEAYQNDQETNHAQDAAVVRQLLRDRLPSGLAMHADAEEVPLTVGDVCASLQTMAIMQGAASREVKVLAEDLRHSEAPLPEELTGRKLRQFFAQIGVSVSERFQELFRETAIFLSMSREQGTARLVAARREPGRRSREKTSKSERGAKKK